MSSHRRLAPVSMRSMHTAMNSPTPTPTVISSTLLLMCGTVSASTCRSGSATVMAKPSKKLTPRMSGRLRVFVSAVPILLPMGVIDCSAPSEKSPMPTVSSTASSRKHSSSAGDIGATNRHKSSTITTIGSTDSAASRIFSVACDRVFSKSPVFLIPLTSLVQTVQLYADYPYCIIKLAAAQ